MPAPQPPRLRDRLIHHTRVWGPYWVVALALLAISEMLWLWQTWPVRDLLNTVTGAGT